MPWTYKIEPDCMAYRVFQCGPLWPAAVENGSYDTEAAAYGALVTDIRKQRSETAKVLRVALKSLARKRAIERRLTRSNETS